jgi:hypothetical protein
MVDQEHGISVARLQEIDKDLASPDEDTRWQAAIALGEFSETAPESIWPLVEKWGSCPVEDTRDAIAACVLEHVLETHFEPFFGRVEQLVQQGNSAFAGTFLGCWQFGEAKLPGNSERFDRLGEQAWWMWRKRRRKQKLKASLAKQRYKREMRQERNRERASLIRSQGPSTETQMGLTLCKQ